MSGVAVPKVVDHEQRRGEVLQATWRLIARDGVDLVTLRSIAEETGWSTGVLQHYFASKRDIVISAHQLAYERVAARIAQRSDGRTAAEIIRIALEEALPLDDERLLEARVEVSGWNLALRDDRFRTIHAESVARWRSGLVSLLEAAGASKSLAVSEADAADLIISLIDAMSAQAVVAPEETTPDRQRGLAERLLTLIGV